MLVGVPVVNALWLDLSPSEIVAILFWRVSSHIASRPQDATRQAKVHIGVRYNTQTFKCCEALFVTVCNALFRNDIGTYIIGSVGR